MSKRNVYHPEVRLMVSPETVETVRLACSPSGRRVWLTQTCRLTVHTLRGVPGKFVDVLLPDCMPSGPTCLEIGLKASCFNGAKRWRLAFRPWEHTCTEGKVPCLKFPGPGRLDIDEEQSATVLLARWSHGGIWAQSFPRMRWEVKAGALRAILIAQAKAWFGFLLRSASDDVYALADYWSSLDHTQKEKDIVVLNRTASHALYDLATQLGWRKLTLREKRKLGLSDDSPQWHKADGLVMHSTGIGTASGCGEHTIRTAHGIYREGDFDRE